MEKTSSARSYLKMPVVILFGSQFLAAIAIFFAIVPALVSIDDTMPSLPVILAIQGGSPR